MKYYLMGLIVLPGLLLMSPLSYGAGSSLLEAGKKEFRNATGYRVRCYWIDDDQCSKGLEKLLSFKEETSIKDKGFAEVTITDEFKDTRAGGNTWVDFGSSISQIETHLSKQY